MRYFLHLCYDGTNYAGWQIQPNVSTIQGEIEHALSIILRDSISIVGCGRTDKGVHATMYYAHFDCSEIEDESNFLFKLNGILPKEIACKSISSVDSHCHARFDASSRGYTYSLHFWKDPFNRQFSTFYPQGSKLDEALLHKCANDLKVRSDFTSFCKAHTDNLTNLCTIHDCGWDLHANRGVLIFNISANRFLRGMVRLIVGSALNVAIGKLAYTDYLKHLELGTRSDKMSSAPANGLALSKVVYPFL